MLSGSLTNSGSVDRILAIYGRSEETWSRKKKLKEKRDPALKRISIPFACSSLLRLKQSKGRFSGGAWVARGAALSSLSSSTVLQFKAKKELATIYMDGPAALPDIFDRIFFSFCLFYGLSSSRVYDGRRSREEYTRRVLALQYPTFARI